jgi:hypothetical protein
VFVYFDTSAVNYVVDRLTIDDAIATKAYQEVRGRQWLLSPVTIFEILNTSDAARRERLIFFSQHLFHEHLLPSPEELIVEFLNEGCPERFARRDFRSSAPISQTWRNLCLDKRKTFIFSSEEIRKKIDGIAKITRDIHKLTRDRSIAMDRNASHVQLDVTLESLLATVPWVKDNVNMSVRARSIHKIALYYAMIFLCAEAGVHPEPLREFWRRAGVEGSFERVLYIVKNHSMLLQRGPLVVMAMATYTLARAKFSRGIYWDSLHAVYITYVNWFLTEDRRLAELRETFENQEFASRLHSPSEMQWTYHERKDNNLPDPWA